MNVAIIVDAASDSVDAKGGQAACGALRTAEHDAVCLPADATLVSALKARRPDVALLALGGRGACDGGVQALLDLLDIPYVGSSAAACRISGDAALLSSVLRAAAALEGQAPIAPAPAGFFLTAEALRVWGGSDAACDVCSERVPGGYPVAVRAARGADPVGRTAAGASELAAALACIADAGDDALVEQVIEGVELTVAVLGSGWDAYALPPVESRVREDGSVELAAPVQMASLSGDEATAQAVRAEVERAALEAYRACGLTDLGCVSVVWDGAQVRTRLVDPAPSFANDAPFAAALAASGLSLAGVLDRLVTL